MRKIQFLVLILLLTSSCEKEDNPIDNKGTVTVSSELFSTGTTYYVMGYSFETEEFLKSPGSNKTADFLPTNRLNPGGEIIGIYFEKLGTTQNGFYKNAEFEDLNSAEDFFNNYTNAVQGPWETLTGDIKEFQVYTFKTSKGNYVKFIVRDVQAVDDMLGDTDHFEVKISYYIQRDGSAIFEE